MVVVSPILAACGGSETGGAATTSTTIGTTGSTEAPSGEASTARALVDMGFVAAYVVERGGQAVVIDTGTSGNAGSVQATLEELGLTWASVSDVILTHAHPDHAGSLAAIAELAPEAALWGGAGDIGSMLSPRAITAVGDGDTVFGMQITETPGHSPGHISVLDDGILFSGDALIGESGQVAGPSSQYSEDMPTAIESVGKLAGYTFSQVNVSHGFPVTGGSDEVAALAATLG